MTHSETDYGLVEDGMIHPQSFLLLHSLSRAEQSRAKQCKAMHLMAAIVATIRRNC